MNIEKQIKEKLKSKGLKLVDLHRRIVAGFGEKAITYRTLQRIVAGQTQANSLSLYQICMGLGTTMRSLKGTRENENICLTTRSNPQGVYFYSADAYAQILACPGSSFTALKLILKPQAKTKPEKNSAQNQCVKLIHALKGGILCVVGKERYPLKKGDSLTLNCSREHYLENRGAKTSQCLIVQSPHV